MHKNEHSLKNVNSYPRQLVEKSFSAKYSTGLIYMLCVLYSKCLIGFIVVFVQSLLAKGPICLFSSPQTTNHKNHEMALCSALKLPGETLE